MFYYDTIIPINQEIQLKQIGKEVTSENLLEIYNQLKLLGTDKQTAKKYKSQICNLISLSLDYLLKSDNYPDVFDTFCSLNFMNEYINLSDLNIYSINLEIIKSFSFILINLQNQTKIYYILSGNLLNQIILKDYSLYDEEFFSFYVSFLKSISLRIDQNTIQLFYIEKNNTFPLIESVIKIYNHRDSMVRNVVRTVILNVLKIKYDKIEEHFCQLPSISYFQNISCHLRDICIKFNEEIIKNGRFNDNFDDIIEELLFIDDIFHLNLKKVNFILLNSLFYYFILPILCGSIVIKEKPKIEINVVIFLIIILFKNIKYETFRNCLFTLIFIDKLNQDIINFLNQPNDPPYYSFLMENKNISFCDFVSQNYSLKFRETLISDGNIYYSNFKKKYPELEEIIQKYKNYLSVVKNKNNKEKNFVDSKEKIETIIMSYFDNNNLEKMNNYHKSISSGTGVKLGIYSFTEETEIFDVCFMSFMKILFEDINDKNENKKDKFTYINNTIKENILNLLNPKDENIILLVNILIYVCQHSNICNLLLNFAKLENLKERINENNLNNNNNENNLNNNINNNNESNDNILEENSLIFSNHNTFIFNNNFFKLNSQIKINFNSGLFNTLLNLFYFISPPFRKITFRLIIKNLENLTLNKKKKLLVTLNEKEKDIFNEIQNNLITKIEHSMADQKIFRENGYIFFSELWNFYQKDTDENLEKDIKLITSSPFILLNENNKYENFPLILKKSLNDTFIFKNDILLYMYIHDLKEIYFEEKKNIEIKKKLIKDENPLIIKNNLELEINKQYNFNELKNKYKQNLISEIVQLKINKNEDYKEKILLISNYFIYFGDLKNDEILFEYKFHLNYLAMYKKEENDKKELNYIINDENENKYDISILFKNENICEEISSKILDNIQHIKNEHVILFKSFFEDEKNSIFGEDDEDDSD